MGKVKKGRPKKKEVKEQKTITSDVLGGFLVVIGLILMVFIGFKNIGSFANIVKVCIKGALGNSAYCLPILFMVVGVHCILSEKKVKPSSEIRRGLVIISLIAATVTIFSVGNIGIFDNFIKVVIDSVNDGIASRHSGGAVGTVIAGIISGIIGVLPTRVLLPLLTFIATLFLCNISFKQFFGGVSYSCNYMIDVIQRLFGTLFRDDEVKPYEYTDSSGNKVRKLSRREKAKIEKEDEENQAKLREQSLEDIEKNLKLSGNDQVQFDFNKLGDKPTEADKKRDAFFKQQREEKEDKGVKEVLTLDHIAHVDEDNYEFPSINLLSKPKQGEVFDKKAIHAVAVRLQKTLSSFGVDARVTNITKGPTVTRYELSPNTGVKVSKIVNLADDIALNLAAKSIRIEAPIPGKAAVGIEVPNSVTESVMLREVIESKTFEDHNSKLAFALGKNAAGEVCVGDIAKMPHVLIAGATGSGKSVCINSIMVSILYKSKPSEVKLILVDPKMVELSGYNGIPHLLIPVVTDPKKAAGALNWAVKEMVDRYNLFASKGVKDIKGYNDVMDKEEGAKLPQIVIIIDELADLMMVAPNDVEEAICRLAQMARAAGMHLVIATQRPSVDVITGIIKANIPSRIAFTVSSQIDSRTILDMAGAEKLLGKGDMLYYPVGETKPLRMQGTFVSEGEIENIVEEIKRNTIVNYDENIIQSINTINKDPKASDAGSDDDDTDALFDDAIELVIDMGQASASMLQRKFKIGYSRAGRIVDQMEERGIISGYDGSKPRKVLISKNEWQEHRFGSGDNGSTSDESDYDESNVNNGGDIMIAQNADDGDITYRAD